MAQGNELDGRMTCPHCLEGFMPARSYQKFCSIKCRKQFDYLNKTAEYKERSDRRYKTKRPEILAKIRKHYHSDPSVKDRQVAATKERRRRSRINGEIRNPDGSQ